MPYLNDFIYKLYKYFTCVVVGDDIIPKRKPLSRCPGYTCRSTMKCLVKSKRCDKIIDCLLGDDESDCKEDEPKDFFREVSEQVGREETADIEGSEESSDEQFDTLLGAAIDSTTEMLKANNESSRIKRSEQDLKEDDAKYEEVKINDNILGEARKVANLDITEEFSNTTGHFLCKK